jgi:D-3-phosphoglycerate dehydrogenase
VRKILITATNYPGLCARGLKLLQENNCEVVVNEFGRPFTPKELSDSAGDVEAVIANIERWDDTVFDLAPKLKIIVRFGTGYDSVDLEAAKRHGVIVCNTPGINAAAVAEHALGLLLGLVREIPRLNALTREGRWPRRIFYELSGRTLGILGFGAVGQQIAKKASGFEFQLIAYDKYPNKDAAKKLGVTLCTLNDVLTQSDYLSVNLPSLPDTYHIINEENIARMKDGVFLVNTARGPLMDENAAGKALESGKIAGMAADVFEKEPVHSDYPLFRLGNYICTPHSAGETYENYDATGFATAQAVVAALNGKEPNHRLV